MPSTPTPAVPKDTPISPRRSHDATTQGDTALRVAWCLQPAAEAAEEGGVAEAEVVGAEAAVAEEEEEVVVVVGVAVAAAVVVIRV
jgi:hypothetical protein